MASPSSITTLPTELHLLIDAELDEASRVALRLTCRMFYERLDIINIDKELYRTNVCYRRLVEAHTNPDLNFQQCRLCAQRWPRDEMFTSTLPQTASSEAIERSYILRRRCGRDSGPGMVSTGYSDICDNERHLFVQRNPAQLQFDPRPPSWSRCAAHICMHCRQVILPSKTSCHCKCRFCGVRPIQVLLHFSQRYGPPRFAIIRTGEVYHAAEWETDKVMLLREVVPQGR